MKRILLLLVFSFCFLVSQAQPATINHYWSVGLGSSTPFFFATYTPGGSNIFTLTGSYTHRVGPYWFLGGGFGIGGAASTKQIYRTPMAADPSAIDTFATAIRNPYVVPVFLRARYIFNPAKASSWLAGMDAGYMLGLVGSQSGNEKVFNYYGAYFSPSLGHCFGFSSSKMRVTVGAGLDLYFEGREDELPPHDIHRDAHLNFNLFATFDLF